MKEICLKCEKEGKRSGNSGKGIKNKEELEEETKERIK